MEKTILEWLKEIPDAEVREKALANLMAAGYSFPKEVKASDFRDAISRMAIWDRTPEGQGYWQAVHDGGLPIRQQDPTTPSSEELLKEALKGCVEALEWALENTNPARPELQSDLYNILTNALTTAKAAI